MTKAIVNTETLRLQHFSRPNGYYGLPGESPTGPRTGVELQRGVVANLLSGANWPGLQDVLH